MVALLLAAVAHVSLLHEGLHHDEPVHVAGAAVTSVEAGCDLCLAFAATLPVPAPTAEAAFAAVPLATAAPCSACGLRRPKPSGRAPPVA